MEMSKLGGENAAKLLLIAEFAERSDLTLAGQAADRKQVVGCHSAAGQWW